MPFICGIFLGACSKKDIDKDLSKNLPVKDSRITIGHTVSYNSYLLVSGDIDGNIRCRCPMILQVIGQPGPNL